MASFPSVLDELGQAAAIAQEYQAGGLMLQVKTNYTPALTVYAQGSGPAGGALAQLLGVQGGARLVDASGNVVAQFGAWPATNPVRVAVAVGVLGLAGFALVRALRGRR